MNNPLSLLPHLYWLMPLIGMLIGYKFVLRFFFGMVIIPEDKIGILTKKFVLFGDNKTLPDGAIIALKGEAGVQVDPLPPGIHWCLWPWQFSVEEHEFTTIPKDSMGIVEARDGKPLLNGRLLASSIKCDSFQDARSFLTNAGQRGPQMAVITPGTYRINTALFNISTSPVIAVTDNMVGIVTTQDGTPLNSGDIAGHEVTGHNMYQDGEAFIKNGGFKGLQEQVILAGKYYINPKFAEIELKPMTNVPIANAGVMISYVGEAGVDVTGDMFKHGNQVSRGQKGVWVEPIDPGKYPINPYTHKLEAVSTANIVLNWATGKSESHKLDENLSTIKLRTLDGFSITMDVSVIIHIPRNDSPKVIARFGSLQNLVTQVLEPLISNHFRNAAQKADAIDFLKNRATRQQEAKEAIRVALAEYNVVGVDTLIGDINPPAELMKTLTDRKIAEQEQVTFVTQREAADQLQKLEQAKALAATQARVVDAERKVQIAEYDAQASVKKASGDAEAKTINAKADAEVLAVVGGAEGAKILAVGNAEAEVIQKKTSAIGQENYALIETARALSSSGQALVPRIVAGGNGANGGIVDVLLANLALTREAHPQIDPEALKNAAV